MRKKPSGTATHEMPVAGDGPGGQRGGGPTGQQGQTERFLLFCPLSPAQPRYADLLATHPFERYRPVILFFL